RRDYGNCRAEVLPASLIHCVCHGYRTIWSPIARNSLANQVHQAQLTGPRVMQAILAEQRHQEVVDFQAICNRLLSWTIAPGRFWLIVAVTKCDLFWDQREEVASWYIPDASSAMRDTAFSRILRDLVDTVGPRRMDVAVLPVSSY